MITNQQARQYAKLLHPALAGFYHDGVVNESDALAAVFHLIKKGYLEPEFIDNNINRGLAFVRPTSKLPPTDFEKAIVKTIFYEKDHVSMAEIGELIKHGAIQTSILTGIDYSRKYPVGLDFEPVHQTKSTIIEDRGRRIIKVNAHSKLSIASVATLILVLTYLVIFQEDRTHQLIMLIFGVLSIVGYIIQSKKPVKTSAVIVPYNQYYAKLHQFLTLHQPAKHTFTYEFIPYAIAFGIDTSWQADFGLKITSG